MNDKKIVFVESSSKIYNAKKNNNLFDDEIAIVFTEITTESYNATKLNTKFDDEWRNVPKDLSDALTKETLTKLGIKK